MQTESAIPVRHSADVQVAVATESDEDRWDRFVASCGDEHGYHAWAWRRVFENAFGHRSIYLVAQRGGIVVGVLPLVLIRSRLFGNSLTSLPFVNYGGVMARDHDAARALATAARDVAAAHHCRHVELRHVAPQFAELPCKHHKVSMRLRVGNDMWETLDRKVRNQIRKAEKSGLRVERGGEGLVSDFYKVFARNMRDLGTPVYSRRLFEEVLRAFPDQAQLHIVRLDGAPIAAGMTYKTSAMVQLPWASSIREFNSLCANVLLYWDAIQFTQQSDAAVFDMGRSTPNEGTYRFKAQWGAEAVPLSWEYQLLAATDKMPNVSPANPKFQLAIAVWQKLPLSLTTRVGPMIVRAIP
jgi:FemAB-related protein (PEP-CTERM system-associated)